MYSITSIGNRSTCTDIYIGFLASQDSFLPYDQVGIHSYHKDSLHVWQTGRKPETAKMSRRLAILLRRTALVDKAMDFRYLCWILSPVQDSYIVVQCFDSYSTTVVVQQYSCTGILSAPSCPSVCAGRHVLSMNITATTFLPPCLVVLLHSTLPYYYRTYMYRYRMVIHVASKCSSILVAQQQRKKASQEGGGLPVHVHVPPRALRCLLHLARRSNNRWICNSYMHVMCIIWYSPDCTGRFLAALDLASTRSIENRQRRYM